MPERALSANIYFLEALLDYDLANDAGYQDAIVVFTDAIEIANTVDLAQLSTTAAADFEKMKVSAYYLRGLCYQNKTSQDFVSALSDYQQAATLTSSWNGNADAEKDALYANVRAQWGMAAYDQNDNVTAVAAFNQYVVAHFVITNESAATADGYAIRKNLVGINAEWALISAGGEFFNSPTGAGPFKRANGEACQQKWERVGQLLADNCGLWAAADVADLQKWLDLMYSEYATDGNYYVDAYFWGFSSAAKRTVNGTFTAAQLAADKALAADYSGFLVSIITIST